MFGLTSRPLSGSKGVLRYPASIFKGDNVLYDQNGKYFDVTAHSFLTSRETSDVRTLFSNAMITPTYRLHINYVDQPSLPG